MKNTWNRIVQQKGQPFRQLYRKPPHPPKPDPEAETRQEIANWRIRNRVWHKSVKPP